MTFFQIHFYLVPFVVGALAELTKMLVEWVKGEKVIFLDPGGMPSGHSAFVSSLVIAVAYREGWQSGAFLISLVFAFIVMYDAVTLRFQAGRHAQAINKHHSTKLRESLGHTRLQVLVGALFGGGVAALLLFI